MHADQPLGEHFRAFADTVERDGGTTYATISRAVADDDETTRLSARALLFHPIPVTVR